MGCKVDLLIPTQISSVHKIETVKCTVFPSWRLWMPDLKHVSPKVECFVISSLSGKAGADTEQGSGCPFGGGSCPRRSECGSHPKAAASHQGLSGRWCHNPKSFVVLSHKTGDYYTCLECVKAGFKWEKPCPTLLQLENIADLESFKCPPKKTPQRTTHRIRLLWLSHTETWRGTGSLLPPPRWFWFRKCASNSMLTNNRERFCFASKKSKTTRECFRTHLSLHLIFLPPFVYLNVLIISICQVNQCILWEMLISPWSELGGIQFWQHELIITRNIGKSWGCLCSSGTAYHLQISIPVQLTAFSVLLPPNFLPHKEDKPKAKCWIPGNLQG